MFVQPEELVMEDPMVGHFLVIGGRNDTENLRTVELLENKPGWVGWTWRKLADLNYGRCYPGVALISGHVVDAGGTPENSVKVFNLPKGDSDHGQWTLLRNSLFKCGQSAWLFQFAGRILKLGKLVVVHYADNWNRQRSQPFALLDVFVQPEELIMADPKDRVQLDVSLPFR